MSAGSAAPMASDLSKASIWSISARTSSTSARSSASFRCSWAPSRSRMAWSSARVSFSIARRLPRSRSASDSMATASSASRARRCSIGPCTHPSRCVRRVLYASARGTTRCVRERCAPRSRHCSQTAASQVVQYSSRRRSRCSLHMIRYRSRSATCTRSCAASTAIACDAELHAAHNVLSHVVQYSDDARARHPSQTTAPTGMASPTTAPVAPSAAGASAAFFDDFSFPALGAFSDLPAFSAFSFFAMPGTIQSRASVTGRLHRAVDAPLPSIRLDIDVGEEAGPPPSDRRSPSAMVLIPGNVLGIEVRGVR